MDNNKKDRQENIEKITKAIESDPENPELYEKRGDLYRDEFNYDKAEEDYTKAIELDPENFDSPEEGED